jgi:hypothetical protein
MAVDAVWSELLSAIKFPLTGKSAGNILDLGLVVSVEMPLSSCSQDVYCALVLQSTCKEQGI